MVFAKNSNFLVVVFFSKPSQKECFLDQTKVTFQTSPKNENFPTALKKLNFTPCAWFGEIQPEKIFFIYILGGKKCFLPEKKSFKKIQKNLNFPEGLFHGFFQNIEFLTMRIKPEKNVFWYSG